jgi:hypothetical protein
LSGGTLTVDARVAETRRPQGWDANFAERERQFVADRLHSIGAVDDAPRFWSELAFPAAWAITLSRERGAMVTSALKAVR